MKDTKKFFEEKIRPMFTYIGFIGAIIMSIAYIVVICILIIGFEDKTSFKQSLLFAGVNAAVGLIIMMFLKVQGQTFASELSENKEVLDKYYIKKAKENKAKSIKYYWITSTIKDVIIKALSILITTFGIIYIVIKGSNDWNMLLLAIVNLLMFICFGMLSLVKTYDFFNNNHIPFIKEKINQLEEKQCQENLTSKTPSDFSQNTTKPAVDSTSQQSKKIETMKTPGPKVYMPLDNQAITLSSINLMMEPLPRLELFSKATRETPVLQVQKETKVIQEIQDPEDIKVIQDQKDAQV